jgi:hypothetical protein
MSSAHAVDDTPGDSPALALGAHIVAIDHRRWRLILDNAGAVPSTLALAPTVVPASASGNDCDIAPVELGHV